MNDVKSVSLSDSILESLNRLYDAKLTNTLSENEFAENISKICHLFVNKIRQGKVSGNEIESMEALIPGPNGDKCFKLKHKGLGEISNKAKKDVYSALIDKDSNLTPISVEEENSFGRTM